MHILLTDVLTCPRCGPDFGLILLARRLEERRVIEGSLGCPNCRERYAVSGGMVDMRPLVGTAPEHVEQAGRARVAEDGGSAAGAEERAQAGLRLAALLGVTDGAGILLVAGPSRGLAASLAVTLEHVEVVAEATEPEPEPAPQPGVNRVVLPAGSLPFADRSLRGVVLSGPAVDPLLEEAVRVLAPMHRLVLEDAPGGARERLEAEGLEVLAEEATTLVALKRERPDPPRLYQLA